VPARVTGEQIIVGTRTTIAKRHESRLAANRPTADRAPLRGSPLGSPQPLAAALPQYSPLIRDSAGED